jgi:hypothetical protein
MKAAGHTYPKADAVRYLLSMGVDVNARDNAGETALSVAQKRLYGGSGSYGNSAEQQRNAEEVVSILRKAMATAGSSSGSSASRQNTIAPSAHQQMKPKQAADLLGAWQDSTSEVFTFLPNMRLVADGDGGKVSGQYSLSSDVLVMTFPRLVSKMRIISFDGQKLKYYTFECIADGQKTTVAYTPGSELWMRRLP